MSLHPQVQVNRTFADLAEAGDADDSVVRIVAVVGSSVPREGLGVGSLVVEAVAADHRMEAAGVDKAAAVSLCLGTAAADIVAAPLTLQAKPRSPGVP
jgi:hypothetical protein